MDVLDAMRSGAKAGWMLGTGAGYLKAGLPGIAVGGAAGVLLGGFIGMVVGFATRGEENGRSDTIALGG
jgi:hypothetical protein